MKPHVPLFPALMLPGNQHFVQTRPSFTPLSSSCQVIAGLWLYLTTHRRMLQPHKPNRIPFNKRRMHTAISTCLAGFVFTSHVEPKLFFPSSSFCSHVTVTKAKGQSSAKLQQYSDVSSPESCSLQIILEMTPTEEPRRRGRLFRWQIKWNKTQKAPEIQAELHSRFVFWTSAAARPVCVCVCVCACQRRTLTHII